MADPTFTATVSKTVPYRIDIVGIGWDVDALTPDDVVYSGQSAHAATVVHDHHHKVAFDVPPYPGEQVIVQAAVVDGVRYHAQQTVIVPSGGLAAGPVPDVENIPGQGFSPFETFDPSDETVDAVKAHASQPDIPGRELLRVYNLEAEGKHRKKLLDWLAHRLDLG